jgi:DNA segregation ATPase FtsK/SpoIIIE, S-DNA-T family
MVMFDWFKNWYKRAFLEEDEIRETPKNIKLNQEREIQAKISYQYPPMDEKSLQPVKKEVRVKRRTVNSLYPKEPFEAAAALDSASHKTSRAERKKRDNKEQQKSFQPTNVPSPVYGYNSRKDNFNKEELDETPAYIRKREQKFESINTITTSESTAINDLQSRHPNVIPFDEIIRKKNEAHLKIPAFKRRMEVKSKDKQHEEHTMIDKIKKQEEEHPLKLNAEHEKLTIKHEIQPAVSETTKEEITETNASRTEDLSSNHYHIPPTYLLDDITYDDDMSQHWTEEQMRNLQNTLKQFGVGAKVTRAVKGPSVTRFEVQPDIGVKVSKITNLADDIKLSLAAKDIRMEAPIPGKHAIGIEVPNQHRRPVSMLELLNTDAFQQYSSKLAVGVGLDIEGSPIIMDLKKMPHGLVAGATGSGKSVFINTTLISLLYKASPDDVKFLLIDPKMVELTPYNHLPHLVAPVITDVKAATAALKWAVDEMESRYERFANEGVRDIDRYNDKVMRHEIMDEKMPYIVIVIDELADLMMVSPQDVEDYICRIAQKARACGIHLLLATQRPSVDVITGLIKSNIPTRIAFSVSSQVDSRTILDVAGAEKLLGRGDMLLQLNGVGRIMRIQGAYVSDQEIERVTNFVKKQAKPDYLFNQEELIQNVSSFEEDEDDLLYEAIELVIDEEKASTSFLQRKFSIGYNRAARLIDRMEEIGLISQQNGSKPREILLSKEQVRELFDKQ